MAKMFYTLEEAAERLGVDAGKIKEMADSGEIQQFRDRDKVMFKRDQIDGLAGGGGEEEETVSAEDTGTISLADSGTIEVEDELGEGDVIDLDTDELAGADEEEDAGAATGISVFDAGEIEVADPMAQTQVTSSFVTDDDELTLDSIGSGSGLLDLTRESDDTSLGAVELLEDITTESGGVADAGEEAPASSTGIFEGAGADSAPAADAGFEPVVEPEPAMMTMAAYAAEGHDPAGDGFGGGMMMGVFATLVVCVLIVLTGMDGSIIQLTEFFGKDQDAVQIMPAAVLGGGSVALGVIGWLIGRARG
ncbi:MAG: excisionase family DNA-binding protein [Planctomycetota bacterium]|jgi:excisionase family DNA binding protein